MKFALKKWVVMLAITSGAASVGVANAAPDFSRLGKDLTPLGAEKAGNKDGSIPAYTGGLTTVPAGFKGDTLTVKQTSG